LGKNRLLACFLATKDKRGFLRRDPLSPTLPRKGGGSYSMRHARHLARELIHDGLADAALHFGVDRLERLAPGGLLFGGQRHELALAGLLYFLERLVILLARDLVGEVGRLLHRLGERGADVGRQALPEPLVDDDGVADIAMLG